MRAHRRARYADVMHGDCRPRPVTACASGMNEMRLPVKRRREGAHRFPGSVDRVNATYAIAGFDLRLPAASARRTLDPFVARATADAADLPPDIASALRRVAVGINVIVTDGTAAVAAATAEV